MHIIIGFVLAALLLWAWLIGHWFARVLVFLLLACTGFATGSLMVNFGLYSGHAPGFLPGVLAGAIGVVLAWPLSSIPTYYQRHGAAAFEASKAAAEPVARAAQSIFVALSAALTIGCACLFLLPHHAPADAIPQQAACIPHAPSSGGNDSTDPWTRRFQNIDKLMRGPDC